MKRPCTLPLPLPAARCPPTAARCPLPADRRPQPGAGVEPRAVDADELRAVAQQGLGAKPGDIAVQQHHLLLTQVELAAERKTVAVRQQPQRERAACDDRVAQAAADDARPHLALRHQRAQAVHLQRVGAAVGGHQHAAVQLQPAGVQRDAGGAGDVEHAAAPVQPRRVAEPETGAAQGAAVEDDDAARRTRLRQRTRFDDAAAVHRQRADVGRAARRHREAALREAAHHQRLRAGPGGDGAFDTHRAVAVGDIANARRAGGQCGAAGDRHGRGAGNADLAVRCGCRGVCRCR